jgi:RNA polymerase sigma factor for flagellar operon FliA
VDSEQLQALWELYFSHRDRSQRDQLILHYSPLVKYVAGRMASGLPGSVEQADLVSYGMFGLIDAIDRFEPERGLKFETFGIPRIRGAILDELRALDWVPRGVRAKARAVETAFAKLEGNLLRSPTDAELASELSMSEAELQAVFAELSLTGLVALDDLLVHAGADREAGSDSVLDRSRAPLVAFELQETRQVLADVIRRMPERERSVLLLYYYEGLTLAEVGEVLGVTESRVCQIHTKAVLHLRARLTEAAVEV